MTTLASVHDVAAAIVDSFDRPISTMKLQKLVYLSHGWSLALRREPLIASNFEAWANGPVSRELFARHRGMFSVGAWEWGSGQKLDEDERVIIDAVVRNYGALSGQELSDLTHVSGTPWRLARERAGVAEGQPSTHVLEEEDMRKHFETLLLPRNHAGETVSYL